MQNTKCIITQVVIGAGKRLIHSVTKADILGTLHLIRNVQQSET
jgi:hypothetical protein